MNALHQISSTSITALLISGVFGLALGSFLNVVICRLPGGWTTFFSSIFSHCPHCGMRIRWYDNIPVISYLLLRGRCRFCGQSISPQYPLVELTMAGISMWLFSLYGPTPFFFLYIVFFGILLAVSVIDLRLRIIPDALVITGCLAGIIGNLFTPLPGWTHAMAGMVFGMVVPLILISTYEWLRNTTLIGGGDIKLLGMIGAFLGWQPLGSILFYSALCGVLVAVAVKLTGKPSRLPFAPFLTLGTVFALFGPDLFSTFKVFP